MNKNELTAKLMVANRKFVALQEAQEKIYQDLLLELGIDDEPHLWVWDFLANGYVEVKDLLKHLKEDNV